MVGYTSLLFSTKALLFVLHVFYNHAYFFFTHYKWVLFICSCLYIFRRESLARGSSYWPSFATWTPYEMMLLLMWSKFNHQKCWYKYFTMCYGKQQMMFMYHLNSLHTVNGKHRTLLVTDGTVSGLSGTVFVVICFYLGYFTYSVFVLLMLRTY